MIYNFPLLNLKRGVSCKCSLAKYSSQGLNWISRGTRILRSSTIFPISIPNSFGVEFRGITSRAISRGAINPGRSERGRGRNCAFSLIAVKVQRARRPSVLGRGGRPRPRVHFRALAGRLRGGSRLVDRLITIAMISRFYAMDNCCSAAKLAESGPSHERDMTEVSFVETRHGDGTY